MWGDLRRCPIRHFYHGQQRTRNTRRSSPWLDVIAQVALTYTQLKDAGLIELLGS